MSDSSGIVSGRLLVVAFEGWNDAGEAASGAVRTLKDLLDLYPVSEVDSEEFFDYQFNRPLAATDDNGNRQLVWPNVTMYGPTSVRGQPAAAGATDSAAVASSAPTLRGVGATGAGVETHSEAAEDEPGPAPDGTASDETCATGNAGDGAATFPVTETATDTDTDTGGTPTAPVARVELAGDADMSVSGTNNSNIYLLLGTEPSRGWKTFTAEILETVRETGVSGIVMLGAMLADVPHTRPISVFVSSENAAVRQEFGVERSSYEGPVGILSVLGAAAEAAGIPTLSIWASVPHYVHNAPSPKATLALIDKLEEIIDVVIPRGGLVDDAASWESGIDALASEDEDMSSYIEQLEQARDTVDSPEASGEAIAQEFEKYFRRGDDTPDGQQGPAGDTTPLG